MEDSMIHKNRKLKISISLLLLLIFFLPLFSGMTFANEGEQPPADKKGAEQTAATRKQHIFDDAGWIPKDMAEDLEKKFNEFAQTYHFNYTIYVFQENELNKNTPVKTIMRYTKEFGAEPGMLLYINPYEWNRDHILLVESTELNDISDILEQGIASVRYKQEDKEPNQKFYYHHLRLMDFIAMAIETKKNQSHIANPLGIAISAEDVESWNQKIKQIQTENIGV